MKFNKVTSQITIGLILLAVTLTACSIGGGTPEAVVSPANYNFGEVGPEPVTTTFAVSNSGDGPLQIKRVTTSCGCTTAEISSQTVAPGQSADLTVTFDPQAHAGAVGQMVRFVYLRTNDPAAAEVEIQISANVVENPVAKEASQ